MASEGTGGRALREHVTRYDGSWVKGKKSGQGRFRFHNGDVYEGEFRDDDVHGERAC